ncbi:DEKNAAC102026 [Brettanomyces naardenensis]|uniref:Transcription elongation factor n=1 Tax=Brettanomyces naardenensis TaxID=13370 RepID=A0A448YJL6_BRENA|nr:DEKNAAC102026 [Brettanomyces naardenensis]
MDVREVKTIITNLEKTKDTKTIVQLLGILKEKVRATEHFLRLTKVGVAVNKLRSNADPEVSSLVKKIIKHWKEEVSKEKKDKHHKQDKAHVVHSSTTKQTEEEVKAAKEAEADGISVKTNGTTSQHAGFVTSKTRTPANDGIKVNFYENTTRNGSISGLYTALAIGSTVQPKDIVIVAKSIEERTFDCYDGKVSDKYRNKMRSLIMNLRNKKNPELREKVLNGELRPEKFVVMNSQELAPESLKKLVADLHQKNLFDAQGAVQKRAVTDRFVCGRCKKREVSYYQMQTRSADEPLTTFCTCENCGNRWKFC